MTSEYDCIIIGGGAAGLMCAATAGHRGRKVLLIDHANKMGKKILMSGGGRCNFTNLNTTPENFLSQNRHFCKSALKRYTPYDFVELVKRHQLNFHDKAPGQLFCDASAKNILNILFAECDTAGVKRMTQCSVERLEKEPAGYTLQTSQGTFTCTNLVIATGGLSIPTMGATGFGYDIAKQFNLPVLPRDAALVPFMVGDGPLKTLCMNMSGVALDVSVTCGKRTFQEPMLFTHRGLSGPSILQISNYWHSGDAVVIDCLPGINLLEKLESLRDTHNKTSIRNVLMGELPKRFVAEYLGDHWSKPADQYSLQALTALAARLQQWTIVPVATEGYRTAEVTRGGVDTDCVSSKTFECTQVSGLYFIGEVLDVTGWLGGYNFQWAWSSGWCAGQYI